MEGIWFSVQAVPGERDSWLELARSVETNGFESLYVADHAGSSAAPFVALAAAAAVTERIRVGTCMINAGMWQPMALANELATLDVVSGGRAVLGIGAGHTPVEWTQSGQRFPSAGERVDRLIELVATIQALLAGETVSHSGQFSLDSARLEAPRPVQRAIPLTVGGNGSRVLSFAAARAERVGVTGTGRTLADGHHHQVDWSPAGVERTVATIRSAAETAGRSPGIEALVQHVEVTDDAERAAYRVAEFVEGALPEDLLSAPFMLIGTKAEIVAELERHRADLGIANFVVRAPTMQALVPIVSS